VPCPFLVSPFPFHALLKGMSRSASPPRSQTPGVHAICPQLAGKGIWLQALVLAPQEPSPSDSQGSGLENTGARQATRSAHALSPWDFNVSLLRRLIGDTGGPEPGTLLDEGSASSRKAGPTQSEAQPAPRELWTKRGAHWCCTRNGGGKGDAVGAPKAPSGEYSELTRRDSQWGDPAAVLVPPLLYRGRHRVLVNTAFRGDLQITLQSQNQGLS